jgi:hypothetical protein
MIGIFLVLKMIFRYNRNALDLCKRLLGLRGGRSRLAFTRGLFGEKGLEENVDRLVARLGRGSRKNCPAACAGVKAVGLGVAWAVAEDCGTGEDANLGA